MKIFRSLKFNKKGQSTVEYVIVFVAIVSVALVSAPLFLRPAVNKYYVSTAGLFNSAANGLDTMAASVPGRFSSTWSDYTFSPSSNLPYTPPTYAEATSGWAEMQARIGQTFYGGGGAGGGGGGGGGGGCGANGCA